MNRRLAALGVGLLGLLAGARRIPVIGSPSKVADSLGIFENQADIGAVLHPGKAEFDAATRTYTVSGSGDNMWGTKDAFHYVWKKAAGNCSLAADLSFVGAGKEAHRKACLVIRQGLDADAAYVDAALHGDGLTSLQFREAHGAATHEVQANLSAPARVLLEKRGNYVRLYLAGRGEELRFPARPCG